MASKKREDISKQAMDLWKKTVKQLEEVSKTLRMGSVIDRIKAEHVKLLDERDKLLKKLGEETFKLIDKNKLKVPGSIQDTYKKLRDLMDRLLGKKPKAKKKAAPKGTAKGAAKKTSKKKTAKKRKVVKKRAAPKA